MPAYVYTRCINALVTKHQDYDRSAIDNYLLTGSCVLFTDFGTLPEFDLDAGVLSGWVCAIRCKRTSGANPPANKEFMAIVHVVGDETVNVTGTRKIFIEIPENLVNDGTLINSEVTGANDQRLGLGIAVIKSELTYPAHTNYIPLREINAGVPTDVRPLLQLKDGIFSTVPASKITGWNRKLFATNGAGALQEIGFGSATQVFTSNGGSALPSFQSPSFDLNGLTGDDADLSTNDKLIYYKSSASGNRKREAKASTSIQGLVKIADANAILEGWGGVIDADMARARIWYTITPWTTYTHAESLAVHTSVELAYTKIKEILVNQTGTFRISFEMSNNGGFNTCTARLYKNGSAFGTERTQSTATYTAYTEDLSVAKWDLIQIYGKVPFYNPASYICRIQNFRIRHDMVDQRTQTNRRTTGTVII